MLTIYKTIGALFVLLGIASIIGNNLSKKPNLSDLKQRVFSWWYILPLFSLSLITNDLVFFILLSLVSIIGLKEFIASIPTREIDKNIIYILYLSIPIQYYLVWTHSNIFNYFIPVFMYLVISFVATMNGITKGMLVAISTLYWGLILTVYCISYIGYLYVIPVSTSYPSGGAGVVLYLVVLTQLNDVAQYCWGKLIGGRKIIPHVSPNKTLAGLIGGVITIVLLSIPLSRLFLSQPPLLAMLTGFIIALSGFFGDILISAVKRDLEIKDFSNLIPGHGGMLDRVDSMIVTAPVLYLFLNIIQSTGTI